MRLAGKRKPLARPCVVIANVREVMVERVSGTGSCRVRSGGGKKEGNARETEEMWRETGGKS